MSQARLADMVKGWFGGDFAPAVARVGGCEVAVKQYRAGDHEDGHRNRTATEITVVISGEVEMLGRKWSAGDIVVVEPGEAIGFTALTDATNVVVKLAGAAVKKSGNKTSSVQLETNKKSAEIEIKTESVPVSSQASPNFNEDFAAAQRLSAGKTPGAALAVWTDLKEHFPERPEPIGRLARVLIELGRYDEADALLADGQARFPGEVFVDYARVAEARRDWPEALRRWQVARERVPDQWLAYLGAAMALRELERYGEADALLLDAQARFPGERALAFEYARIADTRRDWRESLRRWETVRQRLPDHWLGYARAAGALRELGQHDDADALLVEGQALFPGEPAMYLDYPRTAEARRDWPEVLRRWNLARERVPGHWLGYGGAAVALRELKRYDEADALLIEGQARFPDEPTLYLDHARVADAQRDWPQALRRWQLVRERLSGPWGYSGVAAALRELGRLDEAESVLREGLERFPKEATLSFEYARIADARRDWIESLRRWNDARQRQPHHPLGYAHAAWALRELRRYDEADALLTEGQARFPDEPAMFLYYPRMSEARRDWPEALRRWNLARERVPGHWLGFVGAAGALRELRRHDEAEALLLEGQERFPSELILFLDYARLANHRLDWDEAVRRWELVRQKFPQCAEAYLNAAKALSALGREAEADSVMNEVMVRFPGNRQIAVELAWQATRRHDWAAAEAHFASVRTSFPEEAAGYVGGAEVLSNQGKWQDAETMLKTGMALLPTVAEIAVKFALLPVLPYLRERRDWPEAIRRFTDICGRFPNSEFTHVMAIRTLRDAGKFDDAEQLALDAERRMPESSAFAIEYANTAAARSDLAEAVERFARAREKFPNAWGVYSGLGDILSRMSRFDEAERVLEEAVRAFPTEPLLFDRYAEVAKRRNDLKTALSRWIDARERFPHEAYLTKRISDLRLMTVGFESESEEASSAPTAPDQVPVENMSGSSMIAAFESLGGYTYGCEFGIVQRALGAEPIGLLRWAEMSIADITAALESEFDGVGLPETTELIVPKEHGVDDYMTRDRRFNMRMHTYIARDDAPADRVFNQACRRLQYLRKKLIEDLRTGAKIFVFKITERNLTETEIDRLYSAMRRFGENTLLYVRYADTNHPNGTVELTKPGLMIGYIDRFGEGKSGEPLGPNTVSWVNICRQAYAMWRLDERDEGAEPSLISDAA